MSTSQSTEITEFVKFLRRAERRRLPPQVRRAKQNEYLIHVENLFDQVKGYLHDFVLSGDIQVTEEKEVLCDKILGTYYAPGLCIHVYGEAARLVPCCMKSFDSFGDVGLQRGWIGKAIRFCLATETEPDGTEVHVWKVAYGEFDYRELHEKMFLSLLQCVFEPEDTPDW